MFDTLSDRLSGIFSKLTGRGSLSESDVDQAMREVRRALIEADTALEVIKSFTEKVRERAIGQEVIRSVTPGQMVVKIVQDTLTETLGADEGGLDLRAPAPLPIMMVGLQGSGKTTTTAKLAKRLSERDKKRVLMASLDTRRPAAQEQLAVLGQQINVDTLPIISGEEPTTIARRAMEQARRGSYDVIILDTAGRLHIDNELMAENAAVKNIAGPHETLLVADALTGQDAVNLARNFNDQLGITGIVLTRIDGDGRGGAALSMRAITGKPIKLIGTGEKLDGLEDFHPSRIASRILGMGDVVSLVERAAETIDHEKARNIAARMKKGTFDLEDMAEQLKQVQRMGGLGSLMGMMPGIGKMKKQLADANVDNSVVARQLAIISSMTRLERANPKIMNASRKKRVASGSGTRVEEINKLLKMHLQMADMMKKLGRNPGMMGKLLGMGAGPSPAEMERMQAELANMDPAHLPPELRGLVDGAKGGPNNLQMPDFSKMPSGLSSLGSGKSLPGLGSGNLFKGFPGFSGKKK